MTGSGARSSSPETFGLFSGATISFISSSPAPGEAKRRGPGNEVEID